jgi:hypothetical protein
MSRENLLYVMGGGTGIRKVNLLAQLISICAYPGAPNFIASKLIIFGHCLSAALTA